MMVSKSEQNNTEELQPVIIESCGKKYTLLSQLDGGTAGEQMDKQLSVICRQYCLVEWKTQANGNVRFRCPKVGCPVDALFIAQDEAVYALIGRGHNHPLAAQHQQEINKNPGVKQEMTDIEEEEKSEEEDKGNAENLDDEPPGVYIDKEGNHYAFRARMPAALFERHHSLLGLRKICEGTRWAAFFCAQRFELKCPCQMVFFKRAELLYQKRDHLQHAGPMTPEQLLICKGKKKEPSARKVEKMKKDGWKLVAKNVHSEANMKKLLKRRKLAETGDMPAVRYFHCVRCDVRLRWLKRRDEVWQLGAHSHSKGKSSSINKHR